MLRVDYDDVTLHFDDYVQSYGYRTSSNKNVLLYVKDELDNKQKPGYREDSFLGMKCLTIDIPFEKNEAINGVYVFFKSSIFGKGGRLSNPDKEMWEENQFHLIIHYRHQIMRKIMMGKSFWPFRESHLIESYMMRVSVGDVDVMVRRNTNQNPCREGIPDHDKEIAKYVLQSVGCRPPYWSPHFYSSAPCSRQEELRNYRSLLSEASHIGSTKTFYTVETPCRSLERVSYDSIDVKLPQNWMKEQSTMTNESVGMILDFKEWNYKEVKNVKGMDPQALIGR